MCPAINRYGGIHVVYTVQNIKLNYPMRHVTPDYHWELQYSIFIDAHSTPTQTFFDWCTCSVYNFFARACIMQPLYLHPQMYGVKKRLS